MPALYLACLLNVVLTAIVTAIGTPETGGRIQQKQQVEALVAQLGDADAAVRDAAMRALWDLKESALPALEAAAGASNPEVAGRANLLLNRIRLGVGPDAPASLVRLVIQAREAPSPTERAQARLRLAAVQSEAAPAIARILNETLAPGAEPTDPAETVIAELWPADPWLLARVNDELSRIDDGGLLLGWLERAAAQNVSPWAAPTFALATRHRGELDGAIERWRARVAAEPSPENRRILACLLFAGGDSQAADFLSTPGAGFVPVAWALLEGNYEAAAQRAGACPDEISRLMLTILLARSAGDKKGEFAAAVEIRQWLKDNREPLARALHDPAGEVEPGEIPAPLAQALRAMLAALVAGDLPACFALADEIDAAGLVRAHYRRLEFDLGAQVVARHTQQQGNQTRAVQISQRRMREELEMQSRRGLPSPVLSSYATKRIAAVDAAHQGQWVSAAEGYAELVALDDSDPAMRWALGRALVASGQTERGRKQVDDALFMPLANPWVTRALSAEMQLLGEPELALAQLQRSAAWSTFVPADSLAVLETLAEHAMEAGKHEEAGRTLAVAMIMLMDAEVYAQLGDRALYYALYLVAELERARMNQSGADGDWPEAQASLARSLAYLPQTEAAIDLITALDSAGQTGLADRIFIEAFNPIFTAVGRYPQSPLLCNQAAWLAAACSRRLDSALHLAQSAVNSDPSNPAGLDTLAEVYLRRGQPQRALEMLERILALAESQDSVGTYQSSQFLNYLKRRRHFLERSDQVPAD